MIVNHIIPQSSGGVLLCIVAFVVIKAAINRFGGGLNRIPGPRLAGLTDFWRLFVVWGRRPELVHIELHEKYGNIVRLGPRTVSVGDPQAIKIIYGLNSGFIKVRTPKFPPSIAICNLSCTRFLLTTSSRISILFNRLPPMELPYKACSIPPTANFMPSSGERYPMPMQ